MICPKFWWCAALDGTHLLSTKAVNFCLDFGTNMYQNLHTATTYTPKWMQKYCRSIVMLAQPSWCCSLLFSLVILICRHPSHLAVVPYNVTATYQHLVVVRGPATYSKKVVAVHIHTFVQSCLQSLLQFRMREIVCWYTAWEDWCVFLLETDEHWLMLSHTEEDRHESVESQLAKRLANQ